MSKFFSKNKKVILGILFTALCLLVWRIGIHIRAPFLDYKTPTDGSSNIFGFLDIFAGGGLSQFSVLALGVSPYITASIIVQLLQMDIIPAFKEWGEEGEAGREKLNRWTRYISLFLAFVQALALIIGYRVSYGISYFQYIPNVEYNIFTYIYIAIILTAGTAFVLWLADQMTMHGVGSGTSIMIVAGILASFPSMIVNLVKYFITGTTYRVDNSADGALKWQGPFFFVLILVFFILIIVGVVWMEGLVRKIPIQYANRPSGAKLRGTQNSDLPIKLNTASVIPVIFASTLLSIPTTIIGFLQQSGKTVSIWWDCIFNYQKPIGFALYMILTFVFSFFYSFLQIDPDKTADNLKKQNAYIPGVKPGEATAQYISKVLFKVTLLGATYLAVLAALPIIVSACFKDLPASVQIGGTSLMIVVGVAIETVKQMKTTSQSQEYRGFIE